MRTMHRLMSLAVVAGFVLTAIAAAQTGPSVLLTKLEVQELVKRGEPAQQARLAAHFAALADDYAAAAKRYLAMGQNFGSNPNRTLGSGMSAHCKRLSELNTQSATTARELAAYHAKLAAGETATVPAGSARFESGAGAAEPTAKELNALAAKARTPSEHGALEEYFLMLSNRYTTEAAEHAALAQAYRGTKMASAAVEHDRLANLAKDAAKEAVDAAKMHKRFATGTR